MRKARIHHRPAAINKYSALAFHTSLLSIVFASLGIMTRGQAGDTPSFRDRSALAGINFRLENHPTNEKYLIETMTGGCAFLDYDQDGLLDIFLVNGADIVSQPGKP